MEISATLESGGGLGLGKLRVTTERLIFERKKLFGGAGDVTSFPLSSVQTAGLSGLVEKKLKVRAGSPELVFKSGLMNDSNAELKAVSNLLQRAIAGEPIGTPDQTVRTDPPPTAASEPSPPAPATSSTWLDECERLGKLRDSGVLTDEEFAAAKKRLLDG